MATKDISELGKDFIKEIENKLQRDADALAEKVRNQMVLDVVSSVYSTYKPRPTSITGGPYRYHRRMSHGGLADKKNMPRTEVNVTDSDMSFEIGNVTSDGYKDVAKLVDEGNIRSGYNYDFWSNRDDRRGGRWPSKLYLQPRPYMEKTVEHIETDIKRFLDKLVGYAVKDLNNTR